MMKYKRIRTHFYLCILFIINLLFTKQEITDYNMEIPIRKESLDVFHIDYDDFCKQWIPSLLSPLLLSFGNAELNIIDRIEIFNPFEIPEKNEITLQIGSYEFLKEKYKVFLAKLKDYSETGLCYFGLLPKDGINPNLNESYILLKNLRDSNQIDNIIFSFDKWTINSNSIKTKFYLGGSHSHFISNDDNGIIGYCYTNESSLYWGCSFDQIEYNGVSRNLTKDGINFKIYISSEDHIIKIPEKFKDDFDYITGGKCTYDENAHKGEIGLFLSCDELLNADNYFLISLINGDMNITIEIDGNKRFNEGENIDGRTRIIYEDIDYFIFPLIMFKEFHIEFNGEENLIKFYTNDSSILNVTEKDNQKEDKKKGNSKGFIVLLVIIIIVAVLALLYLIFWLLKKRKDSVRSTINKYNKFEDEEDFKNMNEKRVF